MLPFTLQVVESLLLNCIGRPGKKLEVHELAVRMKIVEGYHHNMERLIQPPFASLLGRRTTVN